MKNAMALLLCGLLFSKMAVANDFAKTRLDNWHQWRGPHANGVSPNGNPPLKWDESTNVKWKVEIPGWGSSTPIVWGDKIFVTTAIETARKGKPVPEQPASQRFPSRPGQSTGQRPASRSTQPAAEQPERARSGGAEQARPRDGQAQRPPQRGGGQRGSGRGGRGGSSSRGGGFFGGSMKPPAVFFQFVVLCLDRNSGEVVWRQVANEEQPHEGHHPSHGFASGSPTTDGQTLYVTFGSRGLYSYDLDGNLQWKRDLGDMKTRAGFGEGTSPVIHGDSLIVPWDHEGDSFIVCLDAKTGRDKWRVDRDEQTTWNTPLVVEHDGVTQVIVNATNRTRSYDLASGKVIWECGGQASNPIPSPVAADGVVYCMTGYRGYALNAIGLNSQGDITDSDKIVWHRQSGTPYVSSPLLHDGLLYFVKSRNGILTCVKAESGEELYAEQRLDDVPDVYASIGCAAGKIFVVSRAGTTVVIKHGPELEILATNRLDEGIDASPVFVQNQLFLRGARHLYCISEE